MLNPRTPKSQCFSARVSQKWCKGFDFFSYIGANAIQVSLTLNFGGEGVVPDRRGLNISSIYGIKWGVRHAAHPSWYCLVLWCFHIFWSPNSVVETSMCMLLIFFQTAQNIGFSQVNASCLSPVPFFLFPNSQLIPKCTKHCVFTGKCNLCASRPIFFYSLIRNLFQTAKNIVFSRVNAACVSRPIFSYSLIRNLFQHAQNIVFSRVDVHVSLVPFFPIP